MNPSVNVAAKAAAKPFGQAVFDRVVMDAVDVAGKVAFITYFMLSVSVLPDGVFASCQSCCVRSVSGQCLVNLVFSRRHRVEKSASSRCNEDGLSAG